MKMTRKILIITITVLLVIPQITFASWWNPFTWFKRTTPITQSVSPRNQPTVEELSKKIEMLQKQIDDKNSVQTQKTEKEKDLRDNEVVPHPYPVKTDSTLKVAKCQAEREQAYNTAIQAFDKNMNSRLENLKTQLTQEREVRIAEIYATEDRNKAYCGSTTLDPNGIIACYRGASDETYSLINSTIIATNLAYAKAKKELGDARQQLITQGSPSLDKVYISCLSK